MNTTTSSFEASIARADAWREWLREYRETDPLMCIPYERRTVDQLITTFARFNPAYTALTQFVKPGEAQERMRGAADIQGYGPDDVPTPDVRYWLEQMLEVFAEVALNVDEYGIGAMTVEERHALAPSPGPAPGRAVQARTRTRCGGGTVTDEYGPTEPLPDSPPLPPFQEWVTPKGYPNLRAAVWVIPDEASEAVREAMARKRIQVVEGVCPCGGVAAWLDNPEVAEALASGQGRDVEGAVWGWHAADCPAHEANFSRAVQEWLQERDR
jgi:hypothetical protein